MNPSKQRIIIAEACGWKLKWAGQYNGQPEEDWGSGLAKPPDYLNDIEAMKRAVLSLPHEKCDYREENNFWEFLGQTTGAEDSEVMSKATQRIAMATAKDWCKAFLLTIGKWEYETPQEVVVVQKYFYKQAT
jgi:hypothetical protein